MDPVLILLLVVLALFVVFQIRSSKKRQAEAAERREAMVPGVEVMTNFGLFGTLVSIDEDENIAVLEVAPGSTVRVHRQVLLKPADDSVVADADADADADAETEESGPSLNESTAIRHDETDDDPKRSN